MKHKELYNDWEKLVNDIYGCTKCRLHENRTNAVPGEGSVDAEIMIVGEAPGKTEDEQGRPFVGAAGNLLTRILGSFNIDRESVYITNVVKCRPPNNREPQDDEVESCSIYLLSQVFLIKPKIIIALGNHAGKWFADRLNIRWFGITKMRGRLMEGELMGYQIKVMPTYHPAAALRRPPVLKYIESDIGKAISLVQQRAISKGRSDKKTLLDFIAGSKPNDKG